MIWRRGIVDADQVHTLVDLMEIVALQVMLACGSCDLLLIWEVQP